MILANKEDSLIIEKKRIESEYWKGATDHTRTPTRYFEIKDFSRASFLLNSTFNNNSVVNRKILNVGGGNGKEAAILIKKGAQSVTICDIAPEQLKSARLRINQKNLHNIELMLCGVDYLPIKTNYFDIGLIFFALYHFTSIKPAFYEISRGSERVGIIEIMNCLLNQLLNIFELYLKVKRVKEGEIKHLSPLHSLFFQLCYFFLPPNYGKNEIITHFISILERIINLIILNTQYFAKIFGNTDIIECER